MNRVAIENTRRVLEADFALSSTIHQLLERFDAKKREESYQGSGIRLELGIREDRLDAFRQALANLSRGKARLKVL